MVLLGGLGEGMDALPRDAISEVFLEWMGFDILYGIPDKDHINYAKTELILIIS